jgi:hypothetical protein
MKDNEVDGRAGSSNRVIRANRKVRAVALAACMVSAVAGVMLIQWLLPQGEQYLSKQSPQGALRILQIAVGFIFLSTVPLSVYLFWFGYRVVKWRQIPPPGAWVIRDTRVVEGDPAQRRGRIVIALAVLLLAAGLLSALYFPYRLGRVFHSRVSESATEATEQRSGRRYLPLLSRSPPPATFPCLVFSAEPVLS